MTSLIHPLEKNRMEAGCDEAGRGCLAGPVYAAAVILPEGYKNPLLNDSKQLSEKRRYQLRDEICDNAKAWAIGICSPEEIDEINILHASILAMHKALEKLSIKPDFLMIDGNRFKKYQDIPHQCFVKGDGRFLAIAAASVLAKTYRDDFMKKAHKEYPEYRWDKNKGYPTREHRKAIEKFGTTPWHRMSFKLLEEQLKIDFK